MIKRLKKLPLAAAALIAACSAFMFFAPSDTAFADGADDGYAASPLKGEGTYTQPYIISDKADLTAFAADVNAGNTYDGKYIKQTADIDLSGADFTPIGYGDENSFNGIYMGGGHEISSLTVKYSDMSALFGTMNGEVYSLSLKGGYISGAVAAGIAVRATEEDAIIADCYVEVTLSGERLSAVADDFADGYILNCVSLSEDENGNPASICSYSAGAIELCYSSGAIFTGIKCEKLADNNSFYSSAIKSGGFYKKLNENNSLLYRYNALPTALTNYDEELSFICDDSEEPSFFANGDGEKYNPYIISTASDLISFARYVNGGEEFRNKYIKQAADIDLSGADFIPIGLFESENYFYGVYDGGGHTVSGLSITTEKGSANNGFFGELGGKVFNLGLIDGYIYGNSCASFASHSIDVSAVIANCYSTLTIEGTRSGGIADNFLGYIMGCWYYNEDQALPIVSYNAQSVKYCHNNYINILPETFTGEANANFCIEMKIFSQPDFKKTVNGNLAYVAYELGMSLSEFTKCYSTEYTNFFEHIFAYPNQMYLSYKFVIQIIIVALICVAVIIITFIIQGRKRREKN